MLFGYEEVRSKYAGESQYEHIFISKAFTDTPVPEWLCEASDVHLGGTGFYFDKAQPLPGAIEHHMPDYHLYDRWIADTAEAEQRLKGEKFNSSSFMTQFKDYTECSIGFTTRGCFRKCGFCVNKKYNRVTPHSELNEFFDSGRKRICLLDDNFLGCPDWHRILGKIIETGRPFQFKQGLDERLLTKEKCEVLFSAKYYGDYLFAFDNIEDYEIIESKLGLIREYTSSEHIKFYVLVGYKGTDYEDIKSAFKRIELLMKYGCAPYVMRYQNVDESPWRQSKYRGMYIAIASWCNQPSIFHKMSFREFCEGRQSYMKSDNRTCSYLRDMTSFENEYPEISHYFDMKYDYNNVEA